MKKIVYLWRWWNRRISARYRIREFLDSTNGVCLKQELSTSELGRRKKNLEQYLVDEWMTDEGTLKDWLMINFIYQDSPCSEKLLVKLFEDSLRVPYDFFFQLGEVEKIVYIQVATALVLSGYNKQISQNITVMITEHDSAIFSSLRSYNYHVCKDSDWGLYCNTPTEIHVLDQV